MGPNEKPQTLSYKIEKNTYATVTPMGNWYSMRKDRDIWRGVAEELARQLGKVEYAVAEYENQGLKDYEIVYVGDE